MSKFDAVLKKIEEQTGMTTGVQQNTQTTPTNVAAKPAGQTQPLQPQAIQQAAKILGMDPKALEQIVIASQQNQKTSTPTNQANQNRLPDQAAV